MTRWTGPILGALLAIAIAYGACVGLVAVGHQTFPSGDPNAARRFKQYVPLVEGGAAAMYSFQRVPVTLELRESTTERVNSRFEDPENADLRVVVSALGGLLLVGAALLVGGVVAGRQRAPQQESTFRPAARLAVVFALASFGLSFVLPIGETLLEPMAYARRSTHLTYVPSHSAAFIWPLIWGLIFGSLGVSIARHGRGWRRAIVATIEARSPSWANALRAAVSGLATGLALVLLAGVLTAVVGIAFHTEQAGDVLGSGKNVAGIAEGVVLGLPHATGAGLLGSMGVSGHYEITDLDSKEFATASIFSGEKQRRVDPELGGGFGGPPRDPFQRYDLAVPRYALGGLAIVVIFTVLTGFRAARGAGTDASSAIRSAFMAAAILTIFLWIVAYLVGGHFRFVSNIGRSRSGIQGWAGPTQVEAIIFPLLWTFGGCFVGALLALLKNRLSLNRA